MKYADGGGKKKKYSKAVKRQKLAPKSSAPLKEKKKSVTSAVKKSMTASERPARGTEHRGAGKGPLDGMKNLAGKMKKQRLAPAPKAPVETRSVKQATTALKEIMSTKTTAKKKTMRAPKSKAPTLKKSIGRKKK